MISEFPSVDGTVVALKHDGKFVENVTQGDRCGVLVDKTCFYAESGGQNSDSGLIKTSEVRFKKGCEQQRSRPHFFQTCHVFLVKI